MPLSGDTRATYGADNTEVSIQMFMIAFGIGAAALAIWVDFRHRGARPRNLRVAMLHVALAMLLARFIVPIALPLVGAVATSFASIFLVGLPASVYCLLSMFWIMRQVGDTLNNAGQGPGAGIRS